MGAKSTCDASPSAIQAAGVAAEVVAAEVVAAVAAAAAAPWPLQLLV
jgi:hypothetical protein